MSEQTGALASALVKAQRGFAPALKSSTNPHFKSKYADLSACVEAVIDSLNANGIALIQQTHECESGVTVETVFLHESGESMSCGRLHVPASKNDPQGYGSALTYARRYSLMASCGIAPEDDDGNAATKSAPKATAPITPNSGTLEAYKADNPDDVAYLCELAAELVQLVEHDDDVAGGYEHLQAALLDNEQKLALWAILAPNSKTRNKIKAEGEKHKSNQSAKEA